MTGSGRDMVRAPLGETCQRRGLHMNREERFTHEQRGKVLHVLGAQDLTAQMEVTNLPNAETGYISP